MGDFYTALENKHSKQSELKATDIPFFMNFDGKIKAVYNAGGTGYTDKKKKDHLCVEMYIDPTTLKHNTTLDLNEKEY